MSNSLRSGRAVAAAAIVAVMLLFAGCSSPVPSEGQGGTSAAPTETGGDNGDQGDNGDEDDDDGGDADGDEDPAQEVVRTGPVAQYGGPAYGDQDSTEVVDTGVWCETIVVYWGWSDSPPEGVRFTFEQAVVDRAGLEVEGGVCGTRDADRSCLGMTLEANQVDTISCSIVLRPGPEFEDGTAITFTGSLECPTAEVCDAVAAREIEPGPPLIIDTPDGA